MLAADGVERRYAEKCWSIPLSVLFLGFDLGALNAQLRITHKPLFLNFCVVSFKCIFKSMFFFVSFF